MVDLSVIVVSFNTKALTKQCLESLLKNLRNYSSNIIYELIVVDNGSVDGSVDLIEKLKIKDIHNNLKIKFIKNKHNIGFGKANNQALTVVSGKYVLFLNSDVICQNVNFPELLRYLDQNQKVGALTVDVRLGNGHMDPACHRGFPNIWNSFCYFLKLEKLGGIFGGYHMIGKDLKKIHKIGSGSGAFFLTRKDLMDKLNGFDELFFMYGEDLDLSFRIKQVGYDFIFYPKYQVLHLKHQSGFRKPAFFEAMLIFYKKNYAKNNSPIINWFVYLIIDLKKKLS
ncbi:hypothetical protein AUK04_04500 [Candidatus Roizmanbacteria bacterium CG2_30_33_16]|uniref:Glycosyl transferase family 2 n=5 Tax=Candidatus Roizmaniibacteriota TaxID=1752723 RepID=A0A2M7E5P9_9BACT|nr:glycosyltransferase family 2 protein [Candidatus Roizmanbacteria bacterium]OIP82524.1 MAG: hypothetical protein AUK04_04500 [Candidatus Roizmanbacteria bacterium CG2_30_33_16]PIP64598.1 MAG: glycosyl transferase family 2 [Candidatus Roizmanbacteria bacterium CG22_combo_CG10-13_8_21_14_all_33_16]PIV63057.1 MAG: glycosyl transferase family 2 [Candidatus Roizmanbacteria bacterium CG01_land_8_20_14_3_00_33_9]PIX72337.1 MAG: glycosyl transferase family 2 [Candidatus Roizmanbacteria bacterium CG_4